MKYLGKLSVSLVAALGLGGGAAWAQDVPLTAAPDVPGSSERLATCQSQTFGQFLGKMARDPVLRSNSIAKSVEVLTIDLRHKGKAKEHFAVVDGRTYSGFPLGKDSDFGPYVLANKGKLHHDIKGNLVFLSVETEMQTATLTDYPVQIAKVSWEQIRYAPPAKGEYEGTITGAYGDSGSLIFANKSDGCWELIKSTLERRSNKLRATEAK